MPELPQPFEQEDIRKDPKAVVIGLLIGLLLLCCGAIGFIYREKEKQSERLYQVILDERNQRIENYERMIFWQNQTKTLKARDSLIKQQTAPYVQKYYHDIKIKKHYFFQCSGNFLALSIGLNIRQEYTSAEKEKQMTVLLTQGGNNKIVEKYTRDSITHTVFNEKIINNSTSEKIAALDRSYADSLQKALKISIDKIDQVTKVNGKLEAQLALISKQNDKGQIVKSHKDKYLDLVYYPDTDSVKLAYDINLNEARYSQRKWLLGAKQNFINVYSDDPRVTINGLKSFRLKEKPPNRFGIGLSAGYGLAKDGTTIKASPYFGIGLNYNLIEF